MITAIETMRKSVVADINAIFFELWNALSECRLNKGRQRQLDEAQRNSDGTQPWIAFVGGKIFNDFETWTRNNFDVDDETAGDPGADGVLEPGDPGFGD